MVQTTLNNFFGLPEEEKENIIDEEEYMLKQINNFKYAITTINRY